MIAPRLPWTLAFAAGCATTPPMSTFLTRAPEEVSILAVERTMASGMLVDEDFRLGEYGIDEVSRGVVFTGPPGVRSAGKYEFVTSGGAVPWDASCTFHRTPQGLMFASYSVDCVCAPRGGGPATRVRAQSDESGSYQGSMDLGGATYPMRSHGALARLGTNVNPTFSVGEPRIMAIDVGDSGEVWLGPAAQAERQGAVCVAAGLMLFRPQHAEPHGQK